MTNLIILIGFIGFLSTFCGLGYLLMEKLDKTGSIERIQEILGLTEGE